MISDLGSRICAVIERKGFESVSSAAIQCRISRTQLWDIIHGRKSPSVDTLERIVAALGATMEELYCDDRPTKQRRNRP